MAARIFANRKIASFDDFTRESYLELARVAINYLFAATDAIVPDPGVVAARFGVKLTRFGLPQREVPVIDESGIDSVVNVLISLKAPN